MFLVSVKSRGKCCSVYPLFGCIIDVVVVVVSNLFFLLYFLFLLSLLFMFLMIS